MSQAIGNTTLALARVWHHVDASDRVLGKLAERIALVLMGKHKPVYNPSIDCGDYVVVTNSRHVKVTGRKEDQLVYRKHTMFPGGLKETPYKTMQERKPEEIIRQAVAGMLPKNKLRDRRLERLKIFSGDRMGIVGGNILKNWEDGTLPENYDPSTPTTSKTLEALRAAQAEEQSS
ncbi:50S ribosomal protein L13 [Coprinopsis marcescibilis]|uniref:50S ribosomal protein L13 n=1 Tax=Coprinopsis marcescibilis TaxID=230819 RepID=A0A5C3L7Q4_COPMA|nr:50S ribosomal protein L13 [Coprinopsis marcescibilis]